MTSALPRGHGVEEGFLEDTELKRVRIPAISALGWVFIASKLFIHEHPGNYGLNGSETNRIAVRVLTFES